MRGIIIYLAIILLLTGWIEDVSGQRMFHSDKPAVNTINAETIQNVPLADPFILMHKGTYYAYGTLAANGIAVFESENLITWRKASGRAAEELALHKNDVYGDKWFWAPEIYYLNGRFYMYFSADEHVCVATSDSPLGPFVQAEKKPMITGEKTIDSTIFVDADLKNYMYFVRFNDGLNKSMNFNRFNGELDIWVCELEENLLEVKPGSMRKCISVSQSWEGAWPHINEACNVIAQNGKYYMIYSANSYESQNYGIGYATATSPLGPWIKYDQNPILQLHGDLVGVGHGSMFNDKTGKLRIVFHAHNSRKKIHPRNMFISDVNFRYRNGEYVMEIKNDYILPRIGE